MNKNSLVLNKIESNIDNNENYFEREIIWNGDGIIEATQLIDNGSFETYFLYEKEDEIALGIDCFTFIEVTPKIINVKTEEGIKRYNFENLSKTLTEILNNLSVKNWRAYGIANYSLARFNHGLSVEPEKYELLQLTIPKREIRFYKNKILLRSLDKIGIDELEKLVKNNSNKPIDNIIKRIDTNKITLDEIYTENEEYYKNMVEKAIENIKDNRYEKIVLSRKIKVPYNLDMAATFIAGRKENTPKRSYFLKLENLEVVGYSPETVVEIDKNGWISTLPLAGTRALGNDVDEKEKMKQSLVKDSKEIMEHINTVKYTYEEMKTVCEPKTVSIYDFMTVVERGTVQHLASRIVGEKKKSLTSWDIFNGLFPAATSSGAPKRIAIDAIGKFENTRRNLYGGCVLTYDHDGSLDSALVLRTIFKEGEKTWLHVGAGIGPLCDPCFEFQETCDKISSISKQLIYRNKGVENESI
ncbi:MAG: salicylate synthase [Fusobacteriaceae bacterium]|nr:salicylate synthase [Fusobacteriaceae bacterium]